MADILDAATRLSQDKSGFHVTLEVAIEAVKSGRSSSQSCWRLKFVCGHPIPRSTTACRRTSIRRTVDRVGLCPICALTPWTRVDADGAPWTAPRRSRRSDPVSWTSVACGGRLRSRSEPAGSEPAPTRRGLAASPSPVGYPQALEVGTTAARPPATMSTRAFPTGDRTIEPARREAPGGAVSPTEPGGSAGWSATLASHGPGGDPG